MKNCLWCWELQWRT